MNIISQEARKRQAVVKFSMKKSKKKASEQLCVCDLAEVMGMTQSAISHQLRTLRAGKLVKFRRDGNTIFYSLADSHIFTILEQGMNHVCE